MERVFKLGKISGIFLGWRNLRKLQTWLQFRLKLGRFIVELTLSHGQELDNGLGLDIWELVEDGISPVKLHQFARNWKFVDKEKEYVKKHWSIF